MNADRQGAGPSRCTSPLMLRFAFSDDRHASNRHQSHSNTLFLYEGKWNSWVFARHTESPTAMISKLAFNLPTQDFRPILTDERTLHLRVWQKAQATRTGSLLFILVGACGLPGTPELPPEEGAEDGDARIASSSLRSQPPVALRCGRGLRMWSS